MKHRSIKGFVETSLVDWPGKVASVIFLQGCSFSCGWCHNRKLIESLEDLDDIPLSYVTKRISELSDWVDGVVITGGEPTIHADLPDIIRELRRIVPVKLDTNGANPDMLEKLLKEKLLEGISMDIKAPLEPEAYSKAAGVSVNMDDICRSISLILKFGIWYEFRTTVVPGLHTPEDVTAIRRTLKEMAGGSLSRPLKLQAFKPSENLPEPWRSLPAMDLDGY